MKVYVISSKHRSVTIRYIDAVRLDLNTAKELASKNAGQALVWEEHNSHGLYWLAQAKAQEILIEQFEAE